MFWKLKLQLFLRYNKGRKLFLINVVNNIHDFSSELHRLLEKSHENNIVVFFNKTIPFSFFSQSLDIRLSENILQSDDCEFIDDFVFKKLSLSWYLYNNITSYAGISIGNIVEYDFRKFLIPRIKNLEIIRKLFSDEIVQHVIVIEDTGELMSVAQYMCDARQLSFFGLLLRPKIIVYFKQKLKKTISDFLSYLVDHYAFQRLACYAYVGNAGILDEKLHAQFQDGCDFIKTLSCCLEKGLRLRWSLLRQQGRYLPLFLKKSRKYKNDWKQYPKLWNRLSRDSQFQSSFSYKDIPIWPFVHQKMAEYFCYDFPRIISNLKRLKNLFHCKKNIKLIVLRNEQREFEKCLLFAARDEGVSTLVIQHGIVAEKNGSEILLSDRYATWGIATEQQHIQYGNVPEVMIVVTGNPNFDSLIQWQPKETKHELFRKFKFDDKKGIVLFVTQQVNKSSSYRSFDLFHAECLELLKVMKDFPNYQLVVKVDPYETIDPYWEYIKYFSKLDPHLKAFALKKVNIYTLLFYSDVVITLDSTAALEAMLFYKPIISFNLTKRKDLIPFGEYGAALSVHTVDQLPSAINQTLYDSIVKKRLRMGQKLFLRDYLFELDGKSKDRVINVMRECIATKRGG